MKLAFFLLFVTEIFGITYYVRSDGGTRYSLALAPLGQCNGMYDASLSSLSGTNITNGNCAFNDIRYLWTAGDYCTGTPPCWEWVTRPGDTAIVGQSQDPEGWAIGYNTSTDHTLGVAGDPFGSGAPVPLPGTQDKPIKIYGRNWQNCSLDSMKTLVYGDYQVSSVFSFGNTSWIDFRCFEITDHGSCGDAALAAGAACSRYGATLAHFADTGISTSRRLTHMNFTDISIHGMAGSGWGGPTGDDVNILRLTIKGNSAAGWNADPGDGTTGTGTLTVTHFSIIASGCVELYPIPAGVAFPYNFCTDQDHGGYGDGFGTTTNQSNPAWVIHFSYGEIAYSTQDGFDLLHLGGTDPQGGISQVIIDNCLSYSNMGQQYKLGQSGILRNSVAINNGAAMNNSIGGWPAGFHKQLDQFGRAGWTSILVTISPGRPSIIAHNTFMSDGFIDIEINGDPSCTAETCSLVYVNNIDMQYNCDSSTGFFGCDHGLSNALYAGEASDLAVLKLSSTVYSHNIWVNSSHGCTDLGFTAVNLICPTSGVIVNETFPWWGLADITLAANSPAIGAGIYMGSSDPFLAYDFYGNKRANPPSIGALENGVQFVGLPSWTGLPAGVVTGNSASSSHVSSASLKSASILLISIFLSQLL